MVVVSVVRRHLKKAGLECLRGMRRIISDETDLSVELQSGKQAKPPRLSPLVEEFSGAECVTCATVVRIRWDGSYMGHARECLCAWKSGEGSRQGREIYK